SCRMWSVQSLRYTNGSCARTTKCALAGAHFPAWDCGVAVRMVLKAWLFVAQPDPCAWQLCQSLPCLIKMAHSLQRTALFSLRWPSVFSFATGARVDCFLCSRGGGVCARGRWRALASECSWRLGAGSRGRCARPARVQVVRLAGTGICFTPQQNGGLVQHCCRSKYRAPQAPQ
ncbi:hypothetical protein EMGBD1_19870, partial [Anaerolineaceae bacterium]